MSTKSRTTTHFVDYVVCDGCEEEEFIKNSFNNLKYTWVVEDRGRERDYDRSIHLCNDCTKLAWNSLQQRKATKDQSL